MAAKVPQSDADRAARLLVGIARGTQHKLKAEPGHAQHAACARVHSILVSRPQSQDDGADGWWQRLFASLSRTHGTSIAMRERLASERVAVWLRAVRAWLLYPVCV